MLSGRDGYELESGEILLDGQSLSDMSADERARSGLFLAFQYPIEIPGVSNEDFLRLAYNAKQKFYNKPEVTPLEFFQIINEKLAWTLLPETFIYITAISLAVLHIYNLKYCQCDTDGCCN